MNETILDVLESANASLKNRTDGNSVGFFKYEEVERMIYEIENLHFAFGQIRSIMNDDEIEPGDKLIIVADLARAV